MRRHLVAYVLPILLTISFATIGVSQVLGPSTGKPTGGISIKAFGAVGDGVANDTAAVQAAMNAGARAVHCEVGIFAVDTVTIPSTVRHISGACTLKQRSLNHNTFNVVRPSGLVIEGLTLEGIPGSDIAANNNGIFVSGGSNVLILGVTCTGYRQNCVWVEDSSDVTVDRALGYGLAKGVQFRGVRRGAITNSVFRDTALPSTIFTIAIFLDSSSGHAFGICTDIRIANNLVANYANSQAIEVHAGQRVTITGNIASNVMMGISMNAAVAADTISDVTVSGNTIQGTATRFDGATGGAGIQAAGFDVRHPATNVAIVGNTVRSMNGALLDSSTGAIQAHEADNVTIMGNTIQSTAANAIVVGPAARGVLVSQNTVDHVIPARRASAGILVNGKGTSGAIVDNWLSDATDGVRLGADNYPHLVVDRNRFTSVTSRYVNPKHAITEGVGVYTPGTTVLDAANGEIRFFVIGNPRPTTISDFTNGAEGQILRLQFTDGNTTISRAHAMLAGGVEFAGAANAILTLVKQGRYWREVSRSTKNS
jgi:parallel beta helix pectate lyase-like protein